MSLVERLERLERENHQLRAALKLRGTVFPQKLTKDDRRGDTRVNDKVSILRRKRRTGRRTRKPKKTVRFR